MDTKTFLETILPRSGFIYIARIRKAKGEGRNRVCGPVQAAISVAG